MDLIRDSQNCFTVDNTPNLDRKFIVERFGKRYNLNLLRFKEKMKYVEDTTIKNIKLRLLTPSYKDIRKEA